MDEPPRKFHLFIFVHGYLVPTKEFRHGINEILNDVRDIFEGKIEFQLIKKDLLIRYQYFPEFDGEVKKETEDDKDEFDDI